jgi:hypothetical protein
VSRYHGNVTTHCHATVTHVTMEMHQCIGHALTET